MTPEFALKKGRKILFDNNSECLQELVAYARRQNHRTLVLFALDEAYRMVQIMAERYPQEHRLKEVLDLSRHWAQGKITMPIAKKAILACHAFAKEVDNPGDVALAHAIGQACSSVHVKTHAMGLVYYELTAIVREEGITKSKQAIQNRIEHYLERVRYWSQHQNPPGWSWAGFMLND